ncbi:hypothetical protein BH09PAT1_BH09PAT1_2370 [soil metagenome]
MNFFTPFLANKLWSYKLELFYVSLAFILTLLLPIIAVVVISNTGIKIVADHLASININSHQIEIHDPASGKVLSTFNAATIWPVKGVVTLEFGEIDLPYQPLHTGIDIAGKIGDPVTPFMKGKVTYVGDLSWGYGKHIIIDHGNNIASLYAHLSKIDVKEGDEVQPGDIIGKEGQTGWATGPHVHFEVRVFGMPVNPRTFVIGSP